jgi:hypothetical protein
MTEFPSTLCAPDQEKSCFACCPPIRPPGYEHLQYTNEIKRVLRENTASLRREEKSLLPITGFSCWALGHLDGGFKRIGCLLHPSQNGGEDLRYRVDYGDKCARESCLEAGIFARLCPEARNFWVRLSEGLDSFSYSSRTLNPLFRILGWGGAVLNLVATAERERDLPGDLRNCPIACQSSCPRKCLAVQPLLTCICSPWTPTSWILCGFPDISLKPVSKRRKG